jgi:mono/diheme cytochrome c family protein
MHSKLILTGALIFVSCIFYRCGSALYIPETSDALRTKTTLDSLITGRKLYITNCASCHNLYLPGKFSAREWAKNVTEMQAKAKINEEQKAYILRYLTSKCKI